MHTLYVRNLSDDLYRRIRASATRKRRSISAEVALLVEEALEREELRDQRSQALKRIIERSSGHTLPPGSPDSLTLLREDRGR